MSERRSRLLLEAVVIVASVLFAFGLEAMWSERSAARERDALVHLLREDIVTNVAEFERRSEQGLRHIDALAQLESIMHRAAERPADDSLAVLFLNVYRNTPIRPELAAFEASVGVPAWGGIPSEVKVELTRFRNLRFEVLEELTAVAFARFHDIGARYGGLPVLAGEVPPSTSFRPDYDGILASAEFGTWLNQFLVIHELQQRQREEWIDRLKAVDARLAAL